MNKSMDRSADKSGDKSGNRSGEKSLIIIGAGGHGRVSAEAAQASGWTVAAFYDDAMKDTPLVNDIPVASIAMKEIAATFPKESHAMFVAIGSNNDRRGFFEYGEALGYEMPVIRHPSAQISPSAVIGAGTVIMANVVVNANTRIGKYCILNTACSVDHDNILDDGTQICPGARLAGNVICGRLSFIGTGASVIPGCKIGGGAFLGASAEKKRIAAFQTHNA